MASDRDGVDESRLVNLLWRNHGGSAPLRAGTSGVDVDTVVAAALEIGRSAGLAAVTMRRIGDQLGVSAMTPYRYVPSRRVLLDLMHDTAVQEMSWTEPTAVGPKSRLWVIVEAASRLYQRDAWLLDVHESMPPLGPGWLRRYESELALLDHVPLSPGERDALLTTLDSLARQAARVTRWASDTEVRWESASKALADLVSPEDYPRSDETGRAAAAAGAVADPAQFLETAIAMLARGMTA